MKKNKNDSWKKIYIVGGGKGGVGKSMVSMALLEFLLARNESPILIETDDTNPDVQKTYHDVVTSFTIDLDHVDGWMRLLNLAEEYPGRDIVVNTAARNMKAISTYAQILTTSLPEVERDLVTLWVINRQRDSIELLKKYAEAFPESVIHVLRNGYFGDTSKFVFFNGSKLKQSLAEEDGRTATFPELADRVADDLYCQRLSISKALTSLPIGNRAELRRWWGETTKCFHELLVSE